MNYSIENVKKFIEDNADLVGNRADGILKRASAFAIRGIISDSLTQEIMGDNLLAEAFLRIVFLNIDHIKIGAAVIMKNAEEDRQSASNLKESLDLIQGANVFLIEEWGRDANNHLVSGCCKALNAVINALSSKVNAHEQDEDYVFSRLMEAILRFADFYGVSMGEALMYSGYFAYDQIECMFPKE